MSPAIAGSGERFGTDLLQTGRPDGAGGNVGLGLLEQKRTDGVWHTFDIDHRKPDYFGKISTEQLVPFATPTLEGNPPWNIVLRANGESEHWYRVIVNEETGDVAYILKTDPEWLKTTFEYWLNGSSILRPLGSFLPLLDTPNGKVIPATEGMIFDQLYFLKLDKPDGEWAYVETPENPIVHKGWIRWRNGREFLVDCYFSIKTLGRSGCWGCGCYKQVAPMGLVGMLALACYKQGAPTEQGGVFDAVFARRFEGLMIWGNLVF